MIAWFTRRPAGTFRPNVAIVVLMAVSGVACGDDEEPTPTPVPGFACGDCPAGTNPMECRAGADGEIFLRCGS